MYSIIQNPTKRKTTRLRLIHFLAFSILFSFSCFSQEIKGSIWSEASGLAIPNVDIQVVEANKGAITNDKGLFEIKNLGAGRYTLKISHIGFKSVIKTVDLSKSKTTRLNLVMQEKAIQLEDVEIKPSSTDNNKQISSLDIQLKPIKNSQEVLQIVPGLFIAQHAGGGKAEQIFLRGFDIDHGTDIALSVDGIPVNMVSHAHGQGYADLHFVIPEAIENVRFDKGPYYAEMGNLNTAGFAAFRTKKKLSNNLVKLEGGQFGTFRGVGMFNLLDPAKESSLYLASEYLHSEGYFESPQNLNRYNLLTKYYDRISKNQLLELSLSAFRSSWNASGQIPERAVENGLISRFGAIDNTEGGKTQRFDANAQLTTQLANGGSLKNQIYASKYDFQLVSNFTFFLVNPERGDQITQSENRLIFGSNNSYTKRYTLWGLPAKSKSGLGFRHDDVKDVRLSRTQNKDEIIQDLAYGDILETNIHTYTETEVYFTPRWSLNLGLRYDHFNFSYLDKLQANNTETLQAGIVSPKAQLGFQVKQNLGLYLKAGTGFHSNDSRTVVSQTTNQILPRAYGVDLGVNWKINPRLLFNAAVWQLDLEQEFVYVGDEGIVEAGGASRRRGIDLGIRYQVLKSLSFDFDMNYANPKSKDEEAGNNFIPLAPTFTSIGGVTYKKSGFTGSVRYRFMDDRAANEDYSLTAKGYYLMDVNLKYSFGAYEIGLAVENVLNTEWNEAQFETESRLQNELQPVSEIHFTPGTPFQARASVAYRF